MNKAAVLERAKGYRDRSKNNITIARRRVEKGLQYQYRDRKAKKREARESWIVQINAASRINGLQYGKLINGLSLSGIQLNRKMLASLAKENPDSFKAIAEKAKESILNYKSQQYGISSVSPKPKPTAEEKYIANRDRLKNQKEWHEGFALYGSSKQFQSWSAEQLVAMGVGDLKHLEHLKKQASQEKKGPNNANPNPALD